MSELIESSIEDVYLGTQRVGALMHGTNEMYVRLTHYSIESPGSWTITLPDWVSAYGILMSGGGSGGQAGNGGNNSAGRGGKGGGVRMLRRVLTSDSNRVIKVTIGAGGAGGTSSSAYGGNGGRTTIIDHTSTEYSVSGGTTNPPAPSQNGSETILTFPEGFAEYANLPPLSSYTSGPGGTGNGGSGKRGGGGAGGNGGILNKYTRGGKGGDGFVDIYMWGLPRHGMLPPTRETVQITLGTGYGARDQFRAALTDRGMDHQTVEEIPFDIELVGTGSTQGMFFGCAALTTVPPMGTSNVTNMSYMFYDCSSLTTVPDMDTSQVTSMTAMFYGCSSLTDGNVLLVGRHPEVNTPNMIGSSGLTREPFYDGVHITLGTGYEARDQFRSALTDRGLDYQTVEEIPFGIKLVGTGSTRQMFYGCSSLTTVPPMGTSNVTNMSYMFYGCSSLTTVPPMDTSGVTDMTYMFRGCSSLTTVPDMDTWLVTNMYAMFGQCTELTSVPTMVIPRVSNTGFMFHNCASLTDGNVELYGQSQVSTERMIEGSGLTREPLHVEVISIPKAKGESTSARDAFRGELAARGWDYETITYIPFEIKLIGSGNSVMDLFGDCKKLKSVPTIPLAQAGVTITRGMFHHCSSLTSIGDLDMSTVTNAIYMFWQCTSLTDGNVRLFGKNSKVVTSYMTLSSGLTREPWYT